MAIVKLNCDRIVDWDTFHSTFAEVFGFPDFYGKNMNAWIDCMSYLDEPDAGISTIQAKPGELVTLHLDAVDALAIRCPDQYAAIVECTAFVNYRRVEEGQPGILALSYWK